MLAVAVLANTQHYARFATFLSNEVQIILKTPEVMQNIYFIEKSIPVALIHLVGARARHQLCMCTMFMSAKLWFMNNTPNRSVGAHNSRWQAKWLNRHNVSLPLSLSPFHGNLLLLHLSHSPLGWILFIYLQSTAAAHTSCHCCARKLLSQRMNIM